MSLFNKKGLYLSLLGLAIFAGLFVFISESAGKSAKVRGLNRANSQTVGLAPGDNPLSSGGAESPLIDRDALLPDSGLEGGNLVSTPGSDQISIYTVRPGDSLSEIAEMYGVSVNTILWANDLPRASVIAPGQILVILPITGIRHTVIAGETIESIAKKYRGDAPEITQFNSLESGEKLAVGQVIIIPEGEEAAVSPPYRPATGSGRVASGPSVVGYFLRPIEGGRKTQDLHGYNGVDLATFAGAPILAAAPGSVIVSKMGGWNGGYGNYVVIDHPNGTQTLYAHNSENAVFVGQEVLQGQVIGYIGATGRSTGPHVHFEVRGAKNPF